VRPPRLVMGSALGLLIAACSGLKPPQDLDHEGRAFLGVLARNEIDSALALAQFVGDPDTIRKVLGQAREFIAPFAIDSAQLVGWNVVTMTDTRGDLTYETHAGTRWALFQVQVLRSGSTFHILGLRWQAEAARLAELNAFSLGSRSLAHYSYLLLAIISLLACVGGSVFAGIRRMGLPWVLFCLIGVGKATINWSTGHQTFNPFSIQVLGAGFFRPGLVGPWLLSWSLPLGSILAVLRSRAKSENATPQTGVAA
jgi:hypothetical protein